jgi:hypothetical protein
MDDRLLHYVNGLDSDIQEHITKIKIVLEEVELKLSKVNGSDGMVSVWEMEELNDELSKMYDELLRLRL